MPSLRSRILNGLTRLSMRFVFRRAEPMPVYRERFAAFDRRTRVDLPAGITIEDLDAPVPGRWIRNAGATSRQTILYVHGGAFIMRLANGHTSMVARLCAEARASAFMAWYRLAPEHPFPAAPEDVLRAYRHLLETGYAPQDIIVAGDSAGGNLALVLPHLARRAGLPMPAGVVTLSPITDFAQVSGSWRLNDRLDPMYRVQPFVSPVQHYLQGADIVDPIASPYYGDLRGFPPLLFVLGGLEALLEDSVGMVRKAIEHGVHARIQIWCGMPHVFPLQTLLPESAPAVREVVAWLAQRRDGASPPSPLYRTCVEVFDRTAITGRIRRTTNDRDLGWSALPSPTAP